jgi:hypothetical protein
LEDHTCKSLLGVAGSIAASDDITELPIHEPTQTLRRLARAIVKTEERAAAVARASEPWEDDYNLAQDILDILEEG